jgi:predicted dehydrogenase
MKDVENIDDADPLAMIIDLGNNKGNKQIIFDKPEIKPINAIKTELESFADAILKNKSPQVTIDDGYAALDVAYRIIEKMNF